MCFWKFFAGILLFWAVIFRRGAGVIIRRSKDPETPPATEGPGWRLVSSRRVPDIRPAETGESADEGSGEKNESSPTGDSAKDPGEG